MKDVFLKKFLRGTFNISELLQGENNLFKINYIKKQPMNTIDYF